jgi:hypothetical protein
MGMACCPPALLRAKGVNITKKGVHGERVPWPGVAKCRAIVISMNSLELSGPKKSSESEAASLFLLEFIDLPNCCNARARAAATSRREQPRRMETIVLGIAFEN